MKIKILLSAAVIALATLGFSGISQAEVKKKIEWVHHGSPGGSGYELAHVLIPLLEEKGWDVNEVKINSCVKASNYVKKSNKAAILQGSNLDLGEDNCEIAPTEENYLGVLFTRSMAFCSYDTHAQAITKLRSGKTFTVAYGKGYPPRLITTLGDVSGSKLVPIPYRNSGVSVKGFLAGDTDMLYTNMSKAVKAIKNNKVKCWATTSPIKILDMLPIRNEFPTYKYKDLNTNKFLIDANTDKDTHKALKADVTNIIKEDVFSAYVKKNFFVPAEKANLTIQMIMDSIAPWKVRE